MKTGTSSSRNTVRALATLSSGACSGCAAPSGAVEAFIVTSLVVHALTPSKTPRFIFSTTSSPHASAVRAMAPLHATRSRGSIPTRGFPCYLATSTSGRRKEHGPHTRR